MQTFPDETSKEAAFEKYLNDRIAEAKEALEEHAIFFKRQPLRALGLSHSVFFEAARFEICTETLKHFQANPSLIEFSSFASLTVLDICKEFKHRPVSTPTERLVREAELAVHAHIAEKITRLLKGEK